MVNQKVSRRFVADASVKCVLVQGTLLEKKKKGLERVCKLLLESEAKASKTICEV